MPKAIWENEVIADSNRTIEVEGNQYFPPDSIKKEFLNPNDQHTVCRGKAQPAITTLKWTGRKMPEQRGTIPTLSQPQSRSKTTLRSGVA